MKSNYNQLGQYIEMVSRTNSDLKYGIEDVRGCSNTKQMMQTRANLIGRTYEKFIVLRPQEFVFNRRTTRNGEKIGMAYNNTDRDYIFTNDYVAFRVKQGYLDKLLPDYLYLFFCRDEFDRYARYKSTGSATEFFNWEDMCAVPFKIPPMDFQQLIVNTYKVLNERIALKQKINDNLLNSVQAIFRSWFVDYDPFDGVCPSNWETGCVEDIAEFFDSMRKPLSSLERADMERIYPYYGAVSIVDYVDDYIFDGEYLLVSEDGIYVVDENGHPLIQHISGKFWANNHAHILKGKAGFNEDSLYLFLANTNMAPIVTGAAQPKINQANLKSFPITTPDSETMLKFNNIIQPFFDQRLTNESEIKKLEALQSLLLTRLVD